MFTKGTNPAEKGTVILVSLTLSEAKKLVEKDPDTEDKLLAFVCREIYQARNVEVDRIQRSKRKEGGE